MLKRFLDAGDIKIYFQTGSEFHRVGAATEIACTTLEENAYRSQRSDFRSGAKREKWGERMTIVAKQFWTR